MTRIADEIRAANPAVTIELRTSPCVASVDPDRFEQVISNLIGNAVVHGDTTKPIRIDLTVRERTVSIRVHNEGSPIAPTLLPRLFDPFKYAAASPSRAPGLGLGLCASRSGS